MRYRSKARRRRELSKLYADIAGALIIISCVAFMAGWFHLARIAGAL